MNQPIADSTLISELPEDVQNELQNSISAAQDKNPFVLFKLARQLIPGPCSQFFPYKMPEGLPEEFLVTLMVVMTEFADTVEAADEPPEICPVLAVLLNNMPEEKAREVFLVVITIVKKKFPEFNPFGPADEEEGSAPKKEEAAE